MAAANLVTLNQGSTTFLFSEEHDPTVANCWSITKYRLPHSLRNISHCQQEKLHISTANLFSSNQRSTSPVQWRARLTVSDHGSVKNSRLGYHTVWEYLQPFLPPSFKCQQQKYLQPLRPLIPHQPQKKLFIFLHHHKRINILSKQSKDCFRTKS